MPLTIASQASLDESEQQAVRRLAGRAASQDGTYALNEAAVLNLGHTRPGVTHLFATDPITAPATDPTGLAGYAQMQNDGTVSVTHLVVDPSQRRQGIGLAAAARCGSPGREAGADLGSRQLTRGPGPRRGCGTPTAPGAVDHETRPG